MTTDDRLDRLTETAGNLQTSVEHLTKSLRRNRAGIVLMVVIVGLMGWVLYGQEKTNRQVRQSLAQNYITEQEQQATRVRVLCPLYTVLLASASDPNRATAMTPAQHAQVVAAIQVVRDGYAALGCLPALTG